MKNTVTKKALTGLSDETLSNLSSYTTLPNVAAPRAKGKLPVSVEMHLNAMLDFAAEVTKLKTKMLPC
jgi:hypothetical protein